MTASTTSPCKADRILYGISYFTLLFPLILFALNYFQHWFGIPVALILAWLIYSQSTRETTGSGEMKVPYTQWIVVFIILNIVVYLSGIGGWWYQHFDFATRNYFFDSAVHQSWPVMSGNDEGFIVYPIAYWLPAGLAGKAMGWTAACIGLHLWVVAQLMCAWMLLTRLLANRRWWTVLLFLFWGFAPALIVDGGLTKILGLQPVPFTERVVVYSTISGIIKCFNVLAPAVLCVLIGMQPQTRLRHIGLLTVCVFIYMPIASLGFLPVILDKLTKEYRSSKSWHSLIKTEALFSLGNVVSLILLGAFYVFYSQTPKASLQILNMLAFPRPLLDYMLGFAAIAVLYLMVLPRNILNVSSLGLFLIFPFFYIDGGINDFSAKSNIIFGTIIMVPFLNLLLTKGNKQWLVILVFAGLSIEPLMTFGFKFCPELGNKIIDSGRTVHRIQPIDHFERDFAHWIVPRKDIPAWLFKIPE